MSGLLNREAQGASAAPDVPAALVAPAPKPRPGLDRFFGVPARALNGRRWNRQDRGSGVVRYAAPSPGSPSYPSASLAGMLMPQEIPE